MMNVPEPSTAPDTLASLLWETLPQHRAALLQEAAEFLPSENFALDSRVGRLRVALADHWEQRYSEPIPIQGLRKSLDPPIAIGVVLDFLQLNYAPSLAELERALQRIIATLHREIQTHDRPHQLQLIGSSDSSDVADVPSSLAVGQTVKSLQTLLAADVRFPTIYADPPWQYANTASRAAAENHYRTLSVEAICQEPVRQLAAENAHLHLWTTNAFLRDAFDVIDAWGFEFKSCLVWVKPELGMGNYWRVSHEYLLLGVRGSLTFRERTQSSWLLAPRTVHSRKPGAVRILIEKVSPGPYLELYGRQPLHNTAWTVYGNQIEQSLF